ncbi:MAG: hypothetical protein HY301_19540 [Verrucomicrobia bacterium]|nr:hypothetical protein [Verrucomicrobiota bacterium]
MNLPNYFLADLPPEATLSAGMITEACQTLKRNRAQYLRARTTRSLVELIAHVAENWRETENPFRRHALDAGPAATGFSRETLARGLDGFFAQFTVENLNALLAQELGHAQRLDTFAATGADERANRSALANGPELLAHIAAGNVPNPALTSLVLGLLLRSAQFVKCARGASFLPRLFAHSLYEADAKIGACLEIAEWRGGHHELEDALFAEADCVTATGGDETLAHIRSRVPPRARFVGYGHRLSFGFIAREALSGFGAKKIVTRAADDVVAWDQLGCLSPHVFYVEGGGATTAEQFAELLAQELDRREAHAPRGKISIEEAAAIASRRAIYEVRAAHLPDTRHWASEGSTAWTVVYEADPMFQPSCLNRFIYVKAADSLAAALRAAELVRGKVSTVGLAAPDERAEALALELARWGVTRICPVGKMQHPPLTWRHDGRPALGDLVTWTDWEK